MVARDPFANLDERVSELMGIALDRAKEVRPDLIAGLCGDQGGSPASIAICERLGLDFVCAPLSQLPGARLAAAQARLSGSRGGGGVGVTSPDSPLSVP